MSIHRRLAAVVALAFSTSCVRADGPAQCFVDALLYENFVNTIFELSSHPTRYWNRPENETAVQYLCEKLTACGYTNVTLDPFTYLTVTKHNVYATRLGSVNPTEMYIVGAHLDSFNIHMNFDDCPGADDDASGVSAVLEAARVFAHSRPEVSIRFAFWNNEETGLNGSLGYVAQHRALQGTLEEPAWLGMMQLDMILYDHGPGFPPDADVEYSQSHNFHGHAATLAQFVAGAMDRYGDMLAQVGPNMNFTDSRSFWNDTPAISLRENRRVSEIGNGSNPNWHEPTDRYETYSEADYQFGFNIVRMLVGALGELTNAAPSGDLDGNRGVDIADLSRLLANFDTVRDDPPVEGDLDGDADVDLRDLSALLAQLGTTCP